MATIIENMSIPKSCLDCPLNNGEYAVENYEKRFFNHLSRNAEVRLQEKTERLSVEIKENIMGKIMLNDKQYGVGGINTAEDVSYDNTSSGMTATNVQDAVDELNQHLIHQIRIIKTELCFLKTVTTAVQNISVVFSILFN